MSDPFAHAAPLPGQKTAAPFGSTSPLGGSPFSPASPLASSPFGAGPGNGPAGPTPFGSTSPFGGSFPGPGAPAFGPSPFDAAGQDPGEDQGAAPGTAGRGSPFGAGTPPSPFDQFQAPERDDGMIGAEEGPPPSPLRAMGGAGPVRSAPVAVSEAPPAGSGSAWTASLHDLFKPIRAQARDLDPQEIGRLVASSVREVRQKK
ncbi:MAG: hypothetical protein HY815_34090 [Candidatus Riflebacteria bacterium]|nr:hypothetical protein [Candidatus Riflebacteria bacterium]